MGYRLRFQSQAWATHHVVSRCIQGYHFLKPTPEALARMTGVLGRALDISSGRVELHAYAFLSNHFHLIISSKTSGDLSQFMQYLKGNLTRELGRLYGWRGTIWQSRYSSEEILDQESCDALFQYVTENSVKEGLVDHPSEWGGLHSYHQLVEGKTVEGPWLDRTGLYKAQLSSLTREQATEERFTQVYQVKLTSPMQWGALSEIEYRERCAALSERAIESARVKRAGQRSIGMTQVLAARVEEARDVKRGRRRLCCARSAEVVLVYRVMYEGFRSLYQRVYRALRDGLLEGIPRVESLFPQGGVPPLGVSAPIQRE